MAAQQTFRPSLLLGVGGLGSKVAQNVYNRGVDAGLVAGGRIRVLTFDTDENDSRRLDRLDSRQKLRFSAARVVDDLLDTYPDVERNWFVRPRTDLPMELRKMTLLDGAGQVRMLSRLALHDAYAQGLVEQSVGAMIAELGRYDNREGFDGLINVLIVGSLAGATGSGSFLQIASIVNDLSRARNVEVQVRGLFLMPDIFVRTGAMPQGQIPSVLANGYAAMKEFHAATLKATERAGHYKFDFEFAPGRRLAAGDIPFASLTLIDFEDMKGGNLGRSIPAYQRLCERAAYTLLFTPVGGKTDSVIVNDVRQMTAAAAQGTHNRIAAIGLSAIVYPHTDVVEYLKNRLAVAVLEGDWLRLDRQFEARLRRFQEQRAAGNMTVSEPQQPQAYLEDLRQLALDDQIPFFREIHDQLNPERMDDDGSPVKVPLQQTYLGAFKTQVLRSFWNTGDLEEIEKRQMASQENFASQTALNEEVRIRENRLDSDLRTLEQALVNRPGDIVINLFSLADDLREDEWRDHHVQQFLVRGGPHLVQSRAFLFALRLEIESELSRLSSEAVRTRLFKLASAFEEKPSDKPERRGRPEILTEADAIARRGWVGRVVKGGKDDFVERYITYYNASILALREFAETRLLEKAYRLLSAEIDELIRVGNGLFRDMQGIMDGLREAVDSNEAMHERSVLTENVIYVCADRQCKRSLWADVESAMAGQRLGVESNKSIALELYSAARHNRTRRRDDGLQRLSTLFRTKVVDDFAGQRIAGDFGPIHDLSLVGAVEREASVTGSDPATLFRSLIAVLNRQSDVMVTLTTPSDGQRIQFWALHPSFRVDMARFADPDQMINASGQGNQSIEEPEFSPREMQSVSLRVNLEMKHLAKLSPPQRGGDTASADRAGRYYTEYQNMVTELINAAEDGRVPRTITPHLHRDWHRPGLLPEISESETRRLLANNNRGFAIGLGFDLIVRGVKYDRRVTTLKTLGRIAVGGVSIEIVESHDMFEILMAFFALPEAVRGCLRMFDDTLARLRRAVDPSVLAGLSEPRHLVQILRIAEARNEAGERDSRVVDLVAGYAGVLHEVLAATHLNLPAEVQRRTADQTLVELGRAAIDAIRAERVAAESLEVMEALHARGLEVWRTATGGAV